VSEWGQRPFVATRRFGDATVSVICEGLTTARLGDLLDLPVERVRAAVPEVGPDGEVELAFTVTHVRLGAASVLIDAGLGTKADSTARLSPGIEAGLARLGVQPPEITHVVLTHAHWDHVDGALVERGGQPVPRYPRARHLIGRADLEVGRAGTHPHDLCTAQLEALERVGALDLVDGDHAVAPGITMLDAPGESPGHHAVLVESGGLSFVHLADLYHHPCELAHGWVQERTDPALVQRARERVLGEALRRRAVVVAAHDPVPGWSRVVRPGDTFAIERLGADQ
jgi:glyoxylase-like metal-dependent hydrolase (beta-lactamase superfamily II)